MTLTDAKEIVTMLCGKSGNNRTFVAGVVMLAPIWAKSMSAKQIVKATGFKRNAVERAMANLFRSGIWEEGEGGEPLWKAEWPELLMGGEHFETLSNDRVFELEICLTMDILVADGSAHRWEKDGKFLYKAT